LLREQLQYLKPCMVNIVILPACNKVDVNAIALAHFITARAW
jgi:hypothetical protein